MALGQITNHMRKLLEQLTKDLHKAESGNKAASQRVRTGTIKLEKAAKQYRKESVAELKAVQSGKKPARKAKPAAKRAGAKKAGTARKTTARKTTARKKAGGAKKRTTAKKATGRRKTTTRRVTARRKTTRTTRRPTTLHAAGRTVRRATSQLPRRVRRLMAKV